MKNGKHPANLKAKRKVSGFSENANRTIKRRGYYMKKLAIVLLSLFILSAFSLRANIITNTLTNLTIPNQGILPNTSNSPRHPYYSVIGQDAFSEGYVIIMGLNIARSNNPPAPADPTPAQRLTGITVNITGSLYIDSIVITDRFGEIIGVTGFSYSGNDEPPVNGPTRIDIQNPPLIPLAQANAGFYFIAIRTLDFTPNGTSSTFSVTAGDVTVNPSPLPAPNPADVINNAVTTNPITCELLVTDIMPQSSNNHALEQPDYPTYNQLQPGEQIRPRYDRNQYDVAPVSFSRSVPQVIPWETRTAILSIAASQRNAQANGSQTPTYSTDVLSSITLTVTAGASGAEHFNPNKTFRLGDDQSGPHGITIWRDSNNDGIWDPAVDASIVTPIGNFTQETTTQWTLAIFMNDLLEGNLETPNVDDYFVVIEERSDYSEEGYRQKMGQDYKIWIKEGDIGFGPVGIPIMHAGIKEGQVKTLFNNLYLENVSQERVDPVEISAEADMTYNVIPAIGINIASGGARYDFSATKLQSIRIEVLSIENFDPSVDLAPLSDDILSGLTLWRDNKATGRSGSFDAEDTLIPVSSTPWIYEGNVFDADLGTMVNKYSTTLVLQAWATDQGLLYPFDFVSQFEYPHGGTAENKYGYRGTDFFISLRTSEFMSYGSRFRIKVPREGLWTTAVGKQAYNTLPIISGEMTGNVFTRITSLTGPGNPGLTASSAPTPLFKLELDDNGSNKTVRIEGITVEFYDRGNFNLNDLASFNPLAPDFNGSTGWFDIMNFDTEALKECGLVVYRSTPAGDIDYSSPVMIRRYRYLSWPGAPMGYQLQFSNAVNLPATLYVAIRTSSTFTPGDSFDAGIVGWGLNQLSWSTWGSRAIPFVDINDTASTSYARCQSGIFNPSGTGSVNLVAESEYDYIRLDWSNATTLSSDSFVRYEVIRNGQVIAVITDINQTWYIDYRQWPDPSEGVEYTYSVNIIYDQAGEEGTFPSNDVTSKILAFRDSQLPTDFRLAPGTSTVDMQWTDLSYNPNNPDTFDLRANTFRIKRTFLKDGTEAETIVASQWSVQNPFNIYYERLDSGFPSSNGLESGIYLYELYLQKNTAAGIAESNPVRRSVAVFNEDQPEGKPGSGGGCFIATAVYGTEMAVEVISLKRFRDNFLMKRRLGRAFVRWYYRHSPPVADFIRNRGIMKATVRIGLKPLVWIAGLF